MRFLPQLGLVLALLPAAYGGGPGTAHERLFAHWLADMNARPSRDYRDGIYPTEPGIFFLSGWMMTGQPEYLAAARRQFDLSRSWVDENGVFDAGRSGHFPQGVSRDATARQIYNSYTAWRVLGDPRMLELADACATGMARHIARQPYEYRGGKFTLFATTAQATPPYKVNGNAWIDVNQNAELGLAFTLLYHEPRSRWYRSEEARQIAFEELRAGMSIQNMDTGEIPIGSSPQWIGKYDTMYGAYALFSWTWANRYWKDPEMARHIARAVDWLDPFYDGETRMVHWYPRHRVEKASAGSEWWLVAAFRERGKDLQRLFRHHANMMQDETRPSWMCGEPYLYAMGMPPAILRQAGLPEKWAHPEAQAFARFLEGMRARPTRDYRDGIYPTEPAIFFLAGWMITQRPEYLEAARRQFAVSKSWVNADGIFDCSRSGRFPDGVSRDATARQIYNCYTGYRVSGDRDLLELADRCAAGMARHMRRQPVAFGGRQFLLIPTTCAATPPYKPSGSWIDVNQNAEIGLAFTLLYHDPQSKWHHDPLAREIALTELRASMAVQKMETGEIPIGGAAQWIDKYDTNYGAYALSSWDWANRYWKDPEMARHISRAVDWLDPFFDGETRAVHYWPRHREGRMYPEAAWHCLPPFLAHGKDITRLLRIYEDAIAVADGAGWPRWLAAQPYLKVMGLPPAVLRQCGLP